MNTYEIRYKSARGPVRVTRVSANSECQAVFSFLEEHDLPVLSVTRTDLLQFADKEKEYTASYKGGAKLTITAKCWHDAAREAKERENEFGPLWSVIQSKPC